VARKSKLSTPRAARIDRSTAVYRSSARSKHIGSHSITDEFEITRGTVRALTEAVWSRNGWAKTMSPCRPVSARKSRQPARISRTGPPSAGGSSPSGWSARRRATGPIESIAT
jgi:hypothetical protein